MEILSYSPSIEIYAAVSNNGATEYYDLSDDVTRCTVNRKTDAASTCDFSLQNRTGKYNDLFLPFDRVTVFATKQERVQLFTGYITSSKKFTLYPENLSVSASDSIYRLQQLYWDPGLATSAQLVGAGQGNEFGYIRLLTNVLTKVCGYTTDNIEIGDIPEEVTAWAKKLYEQKITSIKKLKKSVDEFYNILQTSGPKSGGASSSSSSAGASLAGLTAGQSIDIPAEYGNGAFTYEFSHDFSSWGGDVEQRVHDMWAAAGEPYSNGMAVLNGFYLIACTDTFGTVGDRVVFTLADGTQIPCIMQDTKDQSTAHGTPANKWGHDDGQQVIEFSYVQKEATHGYGGPGHAEWMPEWERSDPNKRVARGTNYGSVL